MLSVFRIRAGISGCEVTFVFLSCRKVQRLRDVSREGRVSLAVRSATFAQVLRPVRLRGGTCSVGRVGNTRISQNSFTS